jgi:hypothetical protein
MPTATPQPIIKKRGPSTVSRWVTDGKGGFTVKLLITVVGVFLLPIVLGLRVFCIRICSLGALLAASLAFPSWLARSLRFVGLDVCTHTHAHALPSAQRSDTHV